jgi:hypothetical protein
MTRKTDDDRAYDSATRAGQAAVAGLREALARVGVTLPSLRASEPVAGNAHVALGGCSAGTATKLAEIVNLAADALPELRVRPE